MRITPATLPAEVPYLFPPAPPPRRGEGLAVGLAWRAGDWGGRRSAPVEALLPLGRIPGVALHILQRGPALATRPAGFGIDHGADDVLEAAKRMRGLDLVISVDSMPAHLAAAIGRPTWLLLEREADWRWMEGREDSPWYPTLRILRQPAAGDWDGLAAQVAAELRRLTRG
jgi:hypothetical protein